MSTCPGASIPRLPFTAADTKMSVRVWSPVAGIPVRLKVEDANAGWISVETEATVTTAEVWETLEFDFAAEASGTAALDIANTYSRVSIFMDFGTTGGDAGGARTYYVDDVAFMGVVFVPECPGPAGGVPITFDDPTVTYSLLGFGGAEDATVVPDPVDGSSNVARVVKSASAELWAGTTVATGAAASIDVLPITALDTRMTVRIWAPEAGIPVRLKIEDAADPTHSVETEATTTVAETWHTLTFDFADEASGTAALNPAYTFNKASIFYDFGTTGADGGGGVFYFDDLDMAP
jgi:hypothetical protein